MKRRILYFALLSTVTFYAQTQIGSDIDGEAIEDESGRRSISLSSDGSIVAIGAHRNDGNGTNSGHVRIYQNNSGTWTQIGSDINGEAAYDSSGVSVSLSSDGSIVAIGALRNDGNGISSGHVRIYQNNSGTWTQIGSDIDGEASSNASGASISLSSDGSIVAIGATGNDENATNSGQVRLYENNSGTWTQIGSDLNGLSQNALFGGSVSLSSDGSIVAIGARQADCNGFNSGLVRVYQNISGSWTQIGSDICGETADDLSGGSVSLSSDGNIVAIGATLNSVNGTNSGHVRVFQNNSGTWTQIGSDINGEATGDFSGISISLSSDGSIVAIGAHANDGNGTNSGHVRVYQNILGTWTQIGSDIDGEATGDFSGESVSLSSDGSTVAIGAGYNNGNGNQSGHVRVYDISAEILSISDSFVNQNLSVYPNPSSSKFQIELNSSLSLKSVVLLNNLGQEVLKSSQKVLDVSGISKGVYYLKIATDRGIGIKKVIIK